MTLQECYLELGGDYDDVLHRLMLPKLVDKFLLKFPGDDSYQALCDAMAAGQRQDAFRAAHTLKGVCQNLSLGNLIRAVAPLTELLRPEAASIPKDAYALMDDVQAQYASTIQAIQRYQQTNA